MHLKIKDMQCLLGTPSGQGTLLRTTPLIIPCDKDMGKPAQAEELSWLSMMACA